MYDEALDYDETLDDESFDDESFDDESAEFIGGLIPGLSNVVSSVGSAIGGLLGGPRPTRPPLPGVRLPALGPGVTSAQLNTPAGSATLALPSALVRQDEFRAAIAPLKEGIDRNTARLNTVTADATKLRNDFVKVETDTRNQVVKLRMDTRKALIKARKEQAVAIAKFKKDQSSQQMTNMMISIMMQQQVQSQFNEHTHVETGATTEKPAGGTSNNSMFMLLPLMMQDSGGGSDNMMMPMMMMMAFSNQNRGGA